MIPPPTFTEEEIERQLAINIKDAMYQLGTWVVIDNGD